MHVSVDSSIQAINQPAYGLEGGYSQRIGRVILSRRSQPLLGYSDSESTGTMFFLGSDWGSYHNGSQSLLG